MDERTRTTDHELELAPQFRRASPKPEVKTRPFSKKRIGVGLIVVALLALGIYQIARFVHTAAAPSGRAAPGAVQSVGVSTVSLHDVPVVVDALGTVTPLATVTVQTQISGYLTDVKFTEGDVVKKGAALAEIDQRPYEILKAQYEGQLAHDQGLLAQAKADLVRYQTLAKQNSIALQQTEDQVFLVQQYEGTVKQDQALVAAQALNITYCHIISPVAGRVGLRLVDPGNYVTPSSTTGIAVVTQLQPITVIFTIPEDDLPDVMPQINGGGGTLQVTAFDRANQKQLAVGKVIAVDNQIDTTTGTVKVRAQFDNSDNALFPNQFVNARLLVKTLQNAVTVPTAAIQRGAPGASGGALGSYVYVVNADSTVSVRQIKTGPTTMTPDNISLTEVGSGLKAGDRVVTDGSDRLREGLQVNVTTLDGKPVAAAAAAADSGEHRHNGGRRGGAAGGAGQ
jgi:membrane fusion protein, multidrug efflux system